MSYWKKKLEGPRDFDSIANDLNRSIEELKELAASEKAVMNEKKDQIKNLSLECEDLDEKIEKAKKTANSINKLVNQISTKPEVETVEEVKVVEEEPEPVEQEKIV